MIPNERNVRADYELWLLTDAGVRLAPLDTVQSFSYTKAVNSAMSFTLTMPHTFDKTMLAKDRRVAIYRKPHGGSLALDFMGVIEGLNKAGRVPSRTVTGCGLNGLLERRYVYYYAGSAQAKYTADTTDDAMKQLVRENLGSSATIGNGRKVTNSISATYFTVQANTSLGASINKEFAWNNVLSTLVEFANMSRQAGTEIFFEIVPTTEAAFEFQTFKTMRGADRRYGGNNQIIFGVDYGNLDDPNLSESWSKEVNYAVAGGQGEQAARALGTSEDTARSGVSIFGKSEGFINATNVDGIDAAAVTILDDRAKEQVINGRPQRKFTARIVNTATCAYGLHWGYGDYITATYDGDQFDSIIKAVSVRVDESGDEKIDARIEAYT